MDETPLEESLRPASIRPLVVRWLHYLAPLLVMGLAVQLLLPQLANLNQAWHTILRLPPLWLIAAVAAQLLSYTANGYQLMSLAAMLHDRMTVWRGMLIAVAGGSIGLVAGGLVGSAAAIYSWTLALGVRRRTAALCGTLPLLFSNFLLTLIAILGMIHLLLIHQLPRPLAVSFGVVLTVLMVLVVAGLYGVSHPTWLASRLALPARWWSAVRRRPYSAERVENLVNQMVNTWLILRAGGWRGPAIGALFVVGFDMLTMYLLFMATGHPVAPGVLLTGYGLPLLIGRLGPVPGGVGLVEAIMIGVFAGIGVARQEAVVVILAYRLISFWLPMLSGFILSLFLHFDTRAGRDHAVERL